MDLDSEDNLDYPSARPQRSGDVAERLPAIQCILDRMQRCCLPQPVCFRAGTYDAPTSWSTDRTKQRGLSAFHSAIALWSDWEAAWKGDDVPLTWRQLTNQLLGAAADLLGYEYAVRVSPAPGPLPRFGMNGECVVGLIRADHIAGRDLLDLLGAYAPTWLPQGFGLLIGCRVEGGAVGEASNGGVWTDKQCRQLSWMCSQGRLTTNHRGRMGSGSSWIGANAPSVLFATSPA